MKCTPAQQFPMLAILWWFSAHEDDILGEVNRRSKEKAHVLKQPSFPPGKEERKAAKGQRDKMKAMFSKAPKPDKIPQNVNFCIFAVWVVTLLAEDSN